MDSSLEHSRPHARGNLLRRVAAGVVFLALFLGVMGGAHLYLIDRLALSPAWPQPVLFGAIGLFGLGLAALLVQGVARRHRGPWVTRLAFAAYSWLGFLFYLFLSTAAADLVGSALSALDVLPTDGPDTLPLRRTKAILIVLLAFAATVLALRGGRRRPKVTPLEVTLPGLDPRLDGFRLVQISDIHIGPLLDRRFAKWLSKAVHDCAPDLVAVTGDLVDGSVRRLRHDVAPFAELRARHGVYFVTGNHDFYSGVESWSEHVRSFGWEPLRNRSVRIERDGAAFFLAGVDDPHGAMVEGAGGEDLDAALRGTGPHEPTVLLAHDPSTFRRARRRDVALQLSGHTHGGQIWPFGYAVRLAVPWVAGLYEEQGSQLYVSCGTGFWGPPMRLGTEAEITRITLRAA